MLQQIIEKTSQNSAIEQSQWNKYIVKTDPVVEPAIKEENQSTSRSKIDDGDVDLMQVDSDEDEQEFFECKESHSNISKTNQSETSKSQPDSSSQWREILSQKEDSSDWISTIENDMKQLEDETENQ